MTEKNKISETTLSFISLCEKNSKLIEKNKLLFTVEDYDHLYLFMQFITNYFNSSAFKNKNDYISGLKEEIDNLQEEVDRLKDMLVNKDSIIVRQDSRGR